MINVKQAKKFCKEDISKIKNYDKAIADTTQVWHCHHMTETWWHCTRKELIENECYYHRKACELIFLTPEEHKRLHMKGVTRSEETRKKMSESQKGRTNTDETKKKISATLTGRTVNEETRKKMSEAKKGENNPLYGKHFSEETRRKISEANKGHTVSEETRRKLSESLKGRTSPMKGVTLSEETRKKMSEAMKRRWAAQS